MVARSLLSRTASAAVSALPSTSYLAARQLSSSAVRGAISNFTMPAMSPTMTSGGVAAWKVKEGQAFSAGDVLLEIETDKATMDVEAQDDGVLGKIVIPDGTKDVDVGRVIALLAEEGDDISNLEAPKEEAPSSTPAPAQSSSEPTPAPDSSASTSSSSSAAALAAAAHSHVSFKGPLFPSVQRLIAENHIQDAENKIRGTGIRGMITKGDVLAYLGKAKTPTGTFKEAKGGIAVLGPSPSAKKGAAAGAPASSEPLSGAQLRSLILGGLANSSSAARSKARAAAPAKPAATQALNVALEGYEFATPAKAPKPLVTPATRKDGIRSDDVLWDLI